MRFAALAVAALLVPAVAHAGTRPGSPPEVCAGTAFADVVGTRGDDELSSPGPAQRIYGLRGSDRLTGSATRATCLFGGPNDDVLSVDSGGGVAWGESGRDLLFGSEVADIIVGGTGIDAIAAGGGRDQVSSRDGRPEVVSCGNGEDLLVADRLDVRMECETVRLSGPPAPRVTPTPERTGPRGDVRATVTVPRAAGAGRYRFIYVTPGIPGECGGEGTLAVLGQVRRGQRVTVEVGAPRLGWCFGRAQVALVRDFGYGRPSAVVTRFSFRVR